MTRLHALAAGLVLLAAAASAVAQNQTIIWKKQVLHTKFRADGVAVADVNKDGKMDIITGEHWYEGPDFTKAHEMQPPRDYGTGEKGYSHSFCVWMEDSTVTAIRTRSSSTSPARPASGWKTRRANTATGRSTRSGTAPATKRRSTRISSATASPCSSWASNPNTWTRS